MAKKKAKNTAKKPAKKQVKNASPRAAKSAPKAPRAPKNESGISPLGDRVVVRPLTEDEAGTRSPAGIIIPDTVSKEKPEQGIVVATGPGKYDDGALIPMTVSVGDKVMFSKYGFDEVKVGGKEYFIVSESSILAVITK